MNTSEFKKKIDAAHTKYKQKERDAWSNYKDKKKKYKNKEEEKIEELKEKAGINDLKEKKKELSKKLNKLHNYTIKNGKICPVIRKSIFKLMPRKKTTIDEEITIRKNNIYIYNTTQYAKMKKILNYKNEIKNEIDDKDNKKLVEYILNEVEKLDISNIYFSIKKDMSGAINDSKDIYIGEYKRGRFRVRKKDRFESISTKFYTTNIKDLKEIMRFKRLFKEIFERSEKEVSKAMKQCKKIKENIDDKVAHLTAMDEIDEIKM